MKKINLSFRKAVKNGDDLLIPMMATNMINIASIQLPLFINPAKFRILGVENWNGELSQDSLVYNCDKPFGTDGGCIISWTPSGGNYMRSMEDGLLCHIRVKSMGKKQAMIITYFVGLSGSIEITTLTKAFGSINIPYKFVPHTVRNIKLK